MLRRAWGRFLQGASTRNPVAHSILVGVTLVAGYAISLQALRYADAHYTLAMLATTVAGLCLIFCVGAVPHRSELTQIFVAVALSVLAAHLVWTSLVEQWPFAIVQAVALSLLAAVYACVVVGAFWLPRHNR